MEKKELQIANLSEHLRSLKIEIDIASKTLSSHCLEIEKSKQALVNILRELGTAQEELFNIRAEELSIANRARSEYQRIELAKKEIEVSKKEADEELILKGGELDRLEARIGAKRQEIEGLEKREAGLHMELVRMTEKKQSLTREIQELDVMVNKILSKHKQLESEGADLIKKFLKDKESREKELAALDKKIEEKSRSLDDFKANKDKIEKDLIRKHKDMMILESRFRAKNKDEKFQI